MIISFQAPFQGKSNTKTSARWIFHFLTHAHQLPSRWALGGGNWFALAEMWFLAGWIRNKDIQKKWTMVFDDLGWWLELVINVNSFLSTVIFGGFWAVWPFLCSRRLYLGHLVKHFLGRTTTFQTSKIIVDVNDSNRSHIPSRLEVLLSFFAPHDSHVSWGKRSTSGRLPGTKYCFTHRFGGDFKHVYYSSCHTMRCAETTDWKTSTTGCCSPCVSMCWLRSIATIAWPRNSWRTPRLQFKEGGWTWKMSLMSLMRDSFIWSIYIYTYVYIYTRM